MIGFGLGYDGGCGNIIISGVPCQQFARQWNSYPDYPDYQSQNYNMRPYLIGTVDFVAGVMPNMYMPYSSNDLISQTPRIPTDLLNRGILLDNTEMTTLHSNALAPKFIGANILNDKDRFTTDGCSYDTNRNRCVDSLNFCQGKCKNFGDNLTHDCRCIPEDLLSILGLTSSRK
ncbi:unnamed protein product [Onchocerca flexuosa]|uniref:Peptidase S1 domain-containing protein n=1 Tax=Onchocerca flexuosa TaxID=387005 RepID=A0A183GYR6_9BILA|nr:unnamed protein product [Onchocerca flexuosa]